MIIPVIDDTSSKYQCLKIIQGVVELKLLEHRSSVSLSLHVNRERNTRQPRYESIVGNHNVSSFIEENAAAVIELTLPLDSVSI